MWLSRLRHPARKQLAIYAMAGLVAGCCSLNAAQAEDVLERGGYLARVTGCLGCHSPRKPDGSLNETQLLVGGDHPIRGAGQTPILPPNITADVTKGIGRWSVAEIVACLKKGLTPDGRTLSTAMPWRSQYSELSDADAVAIATYVKTVLPNISGAPAPSKDAKP